MLDVNEDGTRMKVGFEANEHLNLSEEWNPNGESNTI